mmetsp:Transcript_44114/g.146164  ORF Transcript_44114/g.146164 Transcript_44114/m.146164 type:complete len:329 (+) Transcript_44114:263-1249(+)
MVRCSRRLPAPLPPPLDARRASVDEIVHGGGPAAVHRAGGAARRRRLLAGDARLPIRTAAARLLRDPRLRLCRPARPRHPPARSSVHARPEQECRRRRRAEPDLLCAVGGGASPTGVAAAHRVGRGVAQLVGWAGQGVLGGQAGLRAVQRDRLVQRHRLLRRRLLLVLLPAAGRDLARRLCRGVPLPRARARLRDQRRGRRRRRQAVCRRHLRRRARDVRRRLHRRRGDGPLAHRLGGDAQPGRRRAPPRRRHAGLGDVRKGDGGGGVGAARSAVHRERVRVVRRPRHLCRSAAAACVRAAARWQAGDSVAARLEQGVPRRHRHRRDA